MAAFVLWPWIGVVLLILRCIARHIRQMKYFWNISFHLCFSWAFTLAKWPLLFQQKQTHTNTHTCMSVRMSFIHSYDLSACLLCSCVCAADLLGQRSKNDFKWIFQRFKTKGLNKTLKIKNKIQTTTAAAPSTLLPMWLLFIYWHIHSQKTNPMWFDFSQFSETTTATATMSLFFSCVVYK